MIITRLKTRAAGIDAKGMHRLPVSDELEYEKCEHEIVELIAIPREPLLQCHTIITMWVRYQSAAHGFWEFVYMAR